MWYERFVIIISSVSRDFIPHAWGLYSPTFIELGIMLGAFCIFFFLCWVRFAFSFFCSYFLSNTCRRCP
jgi:hypothetical protein